MSRANPPHIEVALVAQGIEESIGEDPAGRKWAKRLRAAARRSKAEHDVLLSAVSVGVCPRWWAKVKRSLGIVER